MIYIVIYDLIFSFLEIKILIDDLRIYNYCNSYCNLKFSFIVVIIILL